MMVLEKTKDDDEARGSGKVSIWVKWRPNLMLLPAASMGHFNHAMSCGPGRGTTA
jgi:hypothetical protein